MIPQGRIASPKSGRLRYVPLTTRLAAALRDHRHLRGPLVLHQDDGSQRAGPSDSGIGRTSGSDDDAAVHDLECLGVLEKCWRRRSTFALRASVDNLRVLK